MYERAGLHDHSPELYIPWHSIGTNRGSWTLKPREDPQAEQADNK